MLALSYLLVASTFVGLACLSANHDAFAADSSDLRINSDVPSDSGKAITPVLIEDAWARPGITGGNTAVFFRVTLPTVEAEDVLSGASSPDANRVELHSHTQNDQGAHQMREIHQMVVKGSRTLQSGGDHVMLIGLTQKLEVGCTVPLTLEFQKAKKLSLNVPVMNKTPNQADQKSAQ